MGLRRSFRPTNKVSNGDFRNGTTNWTSVAVEALTASNRTMSFTVTAMNGRLIQALVLPSVGNKVFFGMLVSANSNLLGAGVTTSPSQLLIFHSGGGTFERITGIYTIPSNPTYLEVKVQDTRTNGWEQVQAREIIVVNLTSILPAELLALSDANLKAWCDNNIPAWFDGTLGGGSFGGIGGLK